MRGLIRTGGGGTAAQTTDGNGNPATNVVVSDIVTATDYFTGTIDTSTTNSATIPDFDQYTSVILRLSGVPGGVTISATGDVTEDQSGVYSTSISFRANNVAQSNTTANIDMTNGTFVREWPIHYSQLKLTVGGTPTAGTCTYYLVCKK
jgi:hypothetical protein